jgi:hypothetical protein
MIKIADVLNELSEKRPVFHSEADFQHALAWTIHEKCSGLNIRLERREVLNNNEKIYFDIFASNGNKTVIIEVKYKTKKLDTVVNGEKFNLKDQDAQDQGRYDFIKDISRLEKALEIYDGTGFAIFLTNDKSYWETPTRDVDAVDEALRIHEKSIICGTLSWKKGTSKGTKSGRIKPIILKGNYTLNWNDYSDVEEQKFRYLLVEIAHDNSV